MPNIVRRIKWDENLSLYVIGLTGLRGINRIKSYNLRTAHQILMKFGQKLQNMICHLMPQMGILEQI